MVISKVDPGSGGRLPRSGRNLDETGRRVAHATAPGRTRAPREATVRVIRTLAELHELRSVWDSVATDWASPMQSHDWARIGAEVFGVDDKLEIYVAGNPPAVAIAPVFRSRRVDERLELIGATDLPEPMDFLYSDASDANALATALARSGVPLWFPRILAESPLPGALMNAYRGRGIVICRPTGGSPWIPLDPSWDDPDHHLDRDRRSNLRRARRISEAMGAVSTEILSPKPADLGPLLDKAYAVEAEGWKGRQGTALVQNPREGVFYRRYAAAACARGILRLCFLRIGGRVAAMQVSAETGNRFWLLKIGYSDEFARCSPGTLLLSETVRYAARRGLRSFEFLGTEEPWIRMWTSRVRPCISLWAYPVSVGGGKALARDSLAALRTKVRGSSWRKH